MPRLGTTTPRYAVTDLPDLASPEVHLDEDGKFLGITGTPPQGDTYAYRHLDRSDGYEMTEKQAIDYVHNLWRFTGATQR